MQNIGKINIKEQKKFNNKLPDLLQSFQIISELHVKSIWDNLWVPTILVVFFSVEKPVWDLELTGIGHDGHEVLKLCSRELTSPKIGIQIPQVCEITVTHQISQNTLTPMPNEYSAKSKKSCKIQKEFEHDFMLWQQ